MMTSAKTELIPPDAELVRVIADPLRLQIVTLLARETLCTTHLVEETGARQTNLSNHLRVLREAGVVDTEPCGRFTYYKLRPDVLATLAGSFTALAETARTTAATDRKRPCP
ncbi:metalloregulator ArsR/SmtB family transcription factor [Streptomyces sp. N2-109]|uniref:Metalloregulator ArsR/SmtB family transcription factor n=1 Tax=Streptomyces gossypii TaxID=2883101 RepID=A0ABT2K0K3_9ACTN|nr:metalloregulator ArsR/SmtB family transcription factor [Streptomyces gossypii]MCT2593164.1 metalloregulator ArsR/SmtB family transcription factor [Streptomyces gossypii]